MSDRRKDLLFKGLFLLITLAVGAGGSWMGIQVGQARLEVRVQNLETTQISLRAKIEAIQAATVTRSENQQADQAQDKRIDDVLKRLGDIQRSQDETLRLLVQIQRSTR